MYDLRFDENESLIERYFKRTVFPANKLHSNVHIHRYNEAYRLLRLGYLK